MSRQYPFLYLLTIILFILILVSLIKWFQQSVLFFPTKSIIWTPSFTYQQLYLDLNSTNHPKPPAEPYISAWYIPSSNPEQKKTVLFCHGNSGNISHRSYIIDLCQTLGLNLLVFDYRGYGESPGRPSIDSICQDGLIVYKYLINQCTQDNIIIWGESLGGAIATYIASIYTPNCLILMCTFSSLDDVIKYQDITKFIAHLLSLTIQYLGSNLPNKLKIKYVKCPIAVIHSTEDEVIPYSCAKILYNSIPHNNKIFIKIQGSHSNPQINNDHLSKLLCFCHINIDPDTNLSNWVSNLSTCLRQQKDNILNNL